MFYMGYEALVGGGHFLAFPHFLITMGRRGCKSGLPSAYQAAIPRAGPLARCIAKLTENRKSPERPIVSGFPGIDTKTALQIGRLFLYESLFLNMANDSNCDTNEPPLALGGSLCTTGVHSNFRSYSSAAMRTTKQEPAL